MGGMVGFTRYVLQMPSPDLELDPLKDAALVQTLANFTTENSDGFSGKWSIWCAR